MDNSFQLYRLRVTAYYTNDGRRVVSKIKNGDFFEVSGENIIFTNTDSFPMYALAAILPLLPAKQRPTDPHDWMTTDCLIADPDPLNGVAYEIKRLPLETFLRSDVTNTPMGG